jgi:S1-C subfamily serine protease
VLAERAGLKVQTSHELKVISLGSSSSVKVGEPGRVVVLSSS